MADAIAVQFTGATTSEGEVFSPAPTASLPNSLGKGPACLVYPPSGILDITARLRADQLDFPVKILIDPTDVPSRSDALYRWYNATRDLIEANVDLDLPDYVQAARMVGARIEIDGETYASADGTNGLFDVIEYTVRVFFRGVISTLGI